MDDFTVRLGKNCSHTSFKDALDALRVNTKTLRYLFKRQHCKDVNRDWAMADSSRISQRLQALQLNTPRLYEMLKPGLACSGKQTRQIFLTQRIRKKLTQSGATGDKTLAPSHPGFAWAIHLSSSARESDMLWWNAELRQIGQLQDSSDIFTDTMTGLEDGVPYGDTLNLFCRGGGADWPCSDHSCEVCNFLNATADAGSIDRQTLRKPCSHFLCNIISITRAQGHPAMRIAIHPPRNHQQILLLIIQPLFNGRSICKSLHDLKPKIGQYRDRLKLALAIATSVLQLHMDPWISALWSWSGLYVEVYHRGPHITFERALLQIAQPEEESCQNFATSSNLFALGLVLIELMTGRNLCVFRESGGSSTPAYKQFTRIEVERLISVMAFSAGPKYEQVVRRCISFGSDDRPKHSTQTTAVAVYELIVKPLEDIFDCFDDSASDSCDEDGYCTVSSKTCQKSSSFRKADQWPSRFSYVSNKATARLPEG